MFCFTETHTIRRKHTHTHPCFTIFVETCHYNTDVTFNLLICVSGHRFSLVVAFTGTGVIILCEHKFLDILKYCSTTAAHIFGF